MKESMVSVSGVFYWTWHYWQPPFSRCQASLIFQTPGVINSMLANDTDWVDGKNVMSTTVNGIPKITIKCWPFPSQSWLQVLKSHGTCGSNGTIFLRLVWPSKKIQQRRTVDLSVNISVALHCNGLTRAPLPPCGIVSWLSYAVRINSYSICLVSK